MALPDPITIAANAPTPSLVFAKTKFDGYGSEMIDTGGNGYSTLIQHQPGKASSRHYVRLNKKVNAVNPITGLTQAKEASVSISFTQPDFGFTNADMSALVQALIDFVNDSEVTTAKLLLNQS